MDFDVIENLTKHCQIYGVNQIEIFYYDTNVLKRIYEIQFWIIYSKQNY